MKKNIFLTLGLGVTLLIASCKKEDVPASASANQTAASVNNTAQWRSLNWTSSKDENITTYSSKISDSSINNNIAASGLVLVFKKDNAGVESLPFQEKSSNAYWYYQVANGSVRINSDSKSEQNLNSQSFSYFIISPEKLSSLETQGKTKVDLMQLSYEEAVGLLK
jgi:hypothetical protein